MLWHPFEILNMNMIRKYIDTYYSPWTWKMLTPINSKPQFFKLCMALLWKIKSCSCSMCFYLSQLFLDNSIFTSSQNLLACHIWEQELKSLISTKTISKNAISKWIKLNGFIDYQCFCQDILYLDSHILYVWNNCHVFFFWCDICINNYSNGLIM